MGACGPLPPLVAGTASRGRRRPYLNVRRCRINNRKGLHFWLRPRPWGNNQRRRADCSRGSEISANDQSKRRTLNIFLAGPGASTRPCHERSASGGGIQQSERTPDQRPASLFRYGGNAAACGHEAERNKVFECEAGCGRQAGERGSQGLQCFPLIRSEIEIALVVHAASLNRDGTPSS